MHFDGLQFHPLFSSNPLDRNEVTHAMITAKLTIIIYFRLVKLLLLLFCTQAFSSSLSCAAQWSIPVAGNTFRTSLSVKETGVKETGVKETGEGESGVRPDLLAWKDTAEVYSIYFHTDRPLEIDLSVLARVPEGRSKLRINVGTKSFKTELDGSDFREHKIGRVKIATAGYCRIDLQGIERTGAFFAEAKDLIVASKTESVTLDFVKNDEGSMFNWGRRGPSVHLRYDVSPDQQLEFAYSEISVPAGYDPVGSFFMANGFSEGYFGFQVNSDKERRVLFSVWSPFKTDNPKDIPPEQKIVALARGHDVHLGEFGNEGSGGQSYLRYPWKAAVAYRFLTRVKPDGKGNTIYAAWFSEADAKQWRLIARFQRPATSKYLTGFHSFLENFDPTRGHLERRGFYSNQWVRDVDGQWHECNSSIFSVDPTGKDHHRLDFFGGSDGNRFYLRNGGFFSQTAEPGAKFLRNSNNKLRPRIDVELLP